MTDKLDVAMGGEERAQFEHLRDLADDDDLNPESIGAGSFRNMEDVLDGSARIEISHAGGEFASLEEDIEDETEDEETGARER